MYNKNCVYLYSLILFNYILIDSYTMDEFYWTTVTSDLKKLFESSISNITFQTAQLCKLPLEMKLNICDHIIKEISLTKDVDYKYSNKLAFSLLHSDCVLKPVTLLDGKISHQYIMQCYGRHNSIKSSWSQDDAFDLYYICGGPYDSSYVILQHEINMMNDLYTPVAMFEDLDLEQLTAIKINYNDLHEELMSLGKVTRNEDFTENETLYLRHKLLINTVKLEKYDSICSLKMSKKIILCEKIITFGSLFLSEWILDKTVFSETSSQCVEKSLYFRYRSDFNADDKIIYQEMFPCYGKHKHKNMVPWYLSAGYRDNSVMVYRPKDELTATSYKIDEQYENVILENLEILTT